MLGRSKAPVASLGMLLMASVRLGLGAYGYVLVLASWLHSRRLGGLLLA